jgi:hypothetical protein
VLGAEVERDVYGDIAFMLFVQVVVIVEAVELRHRLGCRCCGRPNELRWIINSTSGSLSRRP